MCFGNFFGLAWITEDTAKLQLHNDILYPMMDGFAQDWPTLTHTDNGLAMDQLGVGVGVGDLPIDAGFEPQTRARSNTWPCPRPDNFVEPVDELDSTKASNQQLTAGGEFPPFFYLS